MIQLDGGFWLQLSVGNKKDFIKDPRDLIEFTTVEHSGNALPEFILSFISDDETILPMLHEGTVIKATYGKDKNNLEEIMCFTGKVLTKKEGAVHRSFHLNGLCVNQAYITDHKLKTHGNTSGVEAVLAVLKLNFKKVESNITKSKDKQVWIQPSISDKAFVSKVLMHCNLVPSFPITAITASGTFILKDALKAVKEDKVKWRFMSQSVTPEDVSMLSDGMLEIESTFINNWTGYQKITKVFDAIKGAVVDVFTVFKPLISLSSESEKLSGVTYRYKGFKTSSDNTHELYWQCRDHNLVHLSQLSKVEMTQSFVDEYKPIKPLDLAIVKEAGQSSIMSGEYTSGLYFVTTVSRTIQGKKLVTTVGFNRESLNSLRNVKD